MRPWLARVFFSSVVLVSVLAPNRAAAQTGQVFFYPVPWPKAGGAMLVAVPLQNANVAVHHKVASPHNTGYNASMPATGAMALAANAGEPIILYAPDLSTPANADEDDFFLLESDQRLVLSIADDERMQPGSPDRMYFMPATSGTFVGTEFYAGSNGGDPDERVRVLNLSPNQSTVTLSGWVNNQWTMQQTVTVQAGDEAVFDPQWPQTAYRVETSEKSMAMVGYLVDNASAPAPDVATGQTVGTQLMGYGTAWFARAVTPVSYTVESKSGSGWTLQASGTLGADEGIGGQWTGNWDWIRITFSGGVGWAITGTPSLLAQSEWDGYYLPTQSVNACIVGQKFFTHSSSRTISAMANPGTQVNIYDEQSGALLDTYTSTGAWEFHNFFHASRSRVEFSNAPGAVLLVGTLNWGGCDESTVPASCGILEGGYSVPALSAFRCSGSIGSSNNCNMGSLSGCMWTNTDGGMDGGSGEQTDAGAPEEDAGVGEMDAGAPTPDAGMEAVDAGSGVDAGAVAPDAGTSGVPDAGGSGNGGGSDPGHSTYATGGCGCTSGGEATSIVFALAALVLIASRRRVVAVENLNGPKH